MARRMEPGEPAAVQLGFLTSCLTPLVAGLLLTSSLLTGCTGSPRESLPEPPQDLPLADAASVAVDCSTAQGIAGMVCDVDELRALDQKLREVLESAEGQIASDQHVRLHAVHNSWFRERDDCASHNDKQRCVSEAYQQRIAELQARYGLVEQRGPLRFLCADRSVNEVTVTWFDTVPETLIAKRGDSQSLMYRQAGESAYRGRNESLSEQQSTVTLVWGHDAPQLTCQAAD